MGRMTTEKACKKCGFVGGVELFVNKQNRCKKCHVKINKEWKLANQDKVIEQRRRSYERQKEYYHNYRLSNIEKIREYTSHYHRDNKEKRLYYCRHNKFRICAIRYFTRSKNIKAKDIPQELLDLKIAQLQLLREVKAQSK